MTELKGENRILEAENKRLKEEIKDLYDQLQPRKLSEEDKVRILNDFFNV